MDLKKIPPGTNPPDEIHVLIEIPQGGVPVKVRARQGLRGPVREPVPPHRHVLSGQLWVHPEYPLGRWRSMRRPWSSPRSRSPRPGRHPEARPGPEGPPDGG